MGKVKKAIDRKVSCELKDVSVEFIGNTRLPTWIPTYGCACKVFLEKWKWEGKFYTQRGWHHPKGSRDQMKGERKPSTAAPFFCSLIMDPVWQVSLRSPPPCLSPMVNRVPSNCELRKTLPFLRELLPGILSQNQETLPTQSWRLKPNIRSFSQFFVPLSTDCLWFLMGIIQDSVIGQLTRKRNICAYILLISFLPEANVVL